MDYRLKIGEDEYLVEVGTGESAKHEMRLGEQSAQVDALSVDEHRLQLRVDGATRPCFVARTAEGTWVWSDGRARLVTDMDNQPRRRSHAAGKKQKEVTPETPSTVIKILVEKGQQVSEGEGVIVVSAMKMETTLTAPYDGTVTKINADIGANVLPGNILVEIEPALSSNAGDNNE